MEINRERLGDVSGGALGGFILGLAAGCDLENGTSLWSHLDDLRGFRDIP